MSSSIFATAGLSIQAHMKALFLAVGQTCISETPFILAATGSSLTWFFVY